MTTELPEKPLSRKESYLAKIAGEDVTIPEAPESRVEQYLAYIAENGGGGGGGTTNFNQLTNRPKYNGTTMTGDTNIPEVKTYTAGTGLDLTGTEFSVDTNVVQGKLTAGTNVTISDNTISATDTTYSNFVGTDGTAAGTAGLVPAPATTDAGKFLKADGTWDAAGGSSYTAGDGIDITGSVISAVNTGKPKVLTADDYNYPTTGTKDSVALWLLDAGTYENTPGVLIRTDTTNSSSNAKVYVVGEKESWNANNRPISILSTEDITVRVVAENGSLNSTYACKTPNISQSTGTSTTSVMSQNAVTSMVFADPSARLKVQIGDHAQISGYGVAIGANAVDNTGGYNFNTLVGYQATVNKRAGTAIGAKTSAGGIGSIALGYGATTVTDGQMTIAAQDNLGYNNTNYRLLTGLFDPQSAHDAATKGYVDTAVASAGAPVYTNSEFNNLWENA